ncbi:MAG: hypothetical protein KDD47_02495 [Acidobacteria bacterium]|nr:hypothetical protein [Acidobacteriota bacterium]
MSMRARLHRFPVAGINLLSSSILALLFLLPAGAASAQGSTVTVRGFTVEVTSSRALDCAAFRDLAPGVTFDLCYSVPASAQPELVLTHGEREVFTKVVVTTTALDDEKVKTTTRAFHTEPEETFRHQLSLPSAPRAKPGPSPDAPLIKGGTRESFFDKLRTGGFSRPGLYRVEVEVGFDRSTESLLLGVEVKAAGGESEVQEWTLDDGKIRVLTPGCFERQADPVLHLVLTGCEGSPYQVKAVTARRAEGLTLAAYVDNSLAAYRKIWRLESRAEGTDQPAYIKLELLQTLAGKQDFLLKYFVDLGGEILVVTFYGPVDEKETLRRRFGDLREWLRLPASP